MQFALLIYHSPEEFAMREKTITIRISAPGGRTTRRWSRPAFTLAATLLKCRRRQRPSDLEKVSAVYKTGHMPRQGATGRIHYSGASFYRCRAGMGGAMSWCIDRRSGSPAAVARNFAPRIHGMSDGNQEEIHSSVGRAIERVARESYGRLVAYLSVHTHDLASAEDALSEALLSALELGHKTVCRKTPRRGC